MFADAIQTKLKTQILLHLDIKFHSTDKKEKKNKEKKKEMVMNLVYKAKSRKCYLSSQFLKLPIKKKKKEKKKSTKTSVFYRSFGTGLIQIASLTWTSDKWGSRKMLNKINECSHLLPFYWSFV